VVPRRPKLNIAWPSPALLFLLYAVPLLLAIALITPAWQEPDEPFHLLRAVQIAHGGLLGTRAWGSAGGNSDPAIYRAYEPVRLVAMHGERRITRAALAASAAVRWQSTTAYTPFPNTAQYGPVFYLPQAAAYWLGRAGGLTVDHTLLLARTINATLFALIAMSAITIARRARPLLTALLLLPTTLFLATSAGQDSLLLACTALAVALVDRATSDGRPVTPRESLVLAAILTVIAMARPPYAGYLVLLFLITPRPQARAFRLLLPATLIVLAWCVAVALQVSIRLGGADIHQQLALLAADPGRIPGIIAATASAFTLEYWVQLIGVLGWTDTRLPAAYIILASITLALAALASTNGRPRQPLVVLAGVIFAVIATFVLQYLTWTWPGQPLITGVLGRYFMAPAMILALALPRIPWRGSRLIYTANAAIMLQAAVTPAVVLHALVSRYYLF
jgi:uncharacterized membrane protein